MKIINLLKSEFIKNYSLKRILIIILILIASSLFLINFTDNLVGKGLESANDNIQYSIDSFNNSLINANKEENKTFDDYYNIYYYENYIKYMTLLKNMNQTYYNDWKSSAVYDELLPVIMQNYLIEKIKENPNDKHIINACNATIEEELNANEKEIKKLCNNYGLENLDDLYNKNIVFISDYEKLIKDNKYYLYLEYKVKNNMILEDEFTKLIIDKKIENNISDLGVNHIQYKALEKNANIKIMSQEEFEKGNYNHYNSYKEYVAYNTKLKENAIRNREILLYSTENDIKHDISYNYFDNIDDSYRAMNTKLKVNQVLHLSIVVIIIVSITSGGIISNEHNKGTIKNIITTPVKRWKILFSKFLYMILDTYFIWLLGLLIISLLSGIEYGFSDLFTPKLIHTGSQVIEVNYYLHIIKEILIASVPVICFLSILFFISTVSLNTSLTVGITTILGIVAPFLWLLSATGNFNFIVYTPLWYLDCGFMFNNTDLYIESLMDINYNLSMGLIISAIVAIILYIITNIVYIKRDVKN